MPRSKNHKCAACSRIRVEQAQQRECWQGQSCRNRRSYYRHQKTRNSDRRLKYRLNQANTPSPEEPITISVAPPSVTKPLAVAVVYSPPTGGIHAIAFEVWQETKLIARVEAVHSQGWNNLDLAAHTQNVLGDLNRRFGITKLATRKTLPASECPIPNCPVISKN